MTKSFESMHNDYLDPDLYFGRLFPDHDEDGMTEAEKNELEKGERAFEDSRGDGE